MGCTMTPDDVRNLCIRLLPLRQKEAYNLCREYGINVKNADLLRHLLGTTAKRPERYSKEFREECRAMIEEACLSVPEVSKEKGVNPETIYGWVHRFNWKIKKGHDFWTEIKIRTLIYEVRKGTCRKAIAAKLGCKVSSVNSMYARCVKRDHVKKWSELLDKLGV